MITKIATTAVYVDDQQRAVEFWIKLLGFKIHREAKLTPTANWIEIGPEGGESCIVIYPRSLMEDWAERKPSIVFECTNVEETYERLRARGVHFQQEPQDLPWGPFAVFLDPDGNWFGLRENWENRELSKRNLGEQLAISSRSNPGC